MRLLNSSSHQILLLISYLTLCLLNKYSEEGKLKKESKKGRREGGKEGERKMDGVGMVAHWQLMSPETKPMAGSW